MTTRTITIGQQRLRTPVAALAVALLVALALPHHLRAQDSAHSFAWFGELVSVDDTANTVTVQAPVEAHVARYVSSFPSGAPIVMAWVQFDGEADAIRYVGTPDEMEAESGYLVHGQYVGAISDGAAPALTFTVPVSDEIIRALASATPGTAIKMTSPLVQPGRLTPVTAVARDAIPKPRPEPEAVVEHVDYAQIGGPWTVNASIMDNDLVLDCTFEQNGGEFGGSCAGAGPLGDLAVLDGRVSGTSVRFQFKIDIGPGLAMLLTGDLDDTGTRITGNLSAMGSDTPFEANRP